MFTHRKSEDRGKANLGWLNSKHSFSFSSYYDPKHMGYSSLRVLNDDRVEPEHGFPTHSHSDMEIISYVLEGTMAHKDSMGTGAVIKAGEIQVMSAGTGVTHSEYNASKSEPLRFLQIWILPDTKGIKPSYQQPKLSPSDIQGQLRLVISKDHANEHVAGISQDVNVYLSQLDPTQTVRHTFKSGRKGRIKVAQGDLTV